MNRDVLKAYQACIDDIINMAQKKAAETAAIGGDSAIYAELVEALMDFQRWDGERPRNKRTRCGSSQKDTAPSDVFRI